MSGRVMRLVLAIAMLFSTVGMSTASMLCTQKQKMATSSASKASACPKCHSTKPTKNGCCKTVYSHLGVKAEYQKPASTAMDHAAAIVLAVLAEPLAALRSADRPLPMDSTGPPVAASSSERCSLLSTFRI